MAQEQEYPRNTLEQYGTGQAQRQISSLIADVFTKGQAANAAVEENVVKQKEAQLQLDQATNNVISAIATTGQAAKDANIAVNEQVKELDEKIGSMTEAAGFNQLDKNYADARLGLTVNLQKIEDEILAPPREGFLGKIVDYFTRPTRQEWMRAQQDIVEQAQLEQVIANSVSAKANAIKITAPMAKTEQVINAENKKFEAEVQLQQGVTETENILKKADIQQQVTRAQIQTAEQASSYLNSVVNAYLARDNLAMNELQLMNLQLTVAEKQMTYDSMVRDRSAQVAMKQKFNLTENELQGIMRSPDLLAQYTDKFIGASVAPDPQDIRGNQAAGAVAGRSSQTTSGRVLLPTFFTGRDDKFARAKEVDTQIGATQKEITGLEKIQQQFGNLNEAQRKQLVAAQENLNQLRIQRSALYPASGDVNDELITTHISYNGKSRSYIEHIADPVFQDPNSPLGRQIYMNSPYTQELLATNRPGTKILRKIQEDIAANDQNPSTGLRPGQNIDLSYMQTIAGGSPQEIWDFLSMGKEIVTYESDYKFAGFQTPPPVKPTIQFFTVNKGTKNIENVQARLDTFQDLQEAMLQQTLAKRYATDQLATQRATDLMAEEMRKKFGGSSIMASPPTRK